MPKNNSKEKEEKPIGRVTHYFGHIGVAVIELKDKLKVGDEIRIVGGEDTDFTQKVDSMEIDRVKVNEGKKGEAVGLKVKEKAREDYKVYKA